MLLTLVLMYDIIEMLVGLKALLTYLFFSPKKRLLVALSAYGQDECYPCFAGTFNSKVISQNCSDCGRGSCTLPQNCSICSAGFFSGDGESQCTQCSPGTIAAQAGASMCERVSPGYTSVSPFEKAQACPGGSKEVDNVCISCALGEYSPEASIHCLSCPPGSFSPKPCSSCQLCPDGFYSSQAGQTSIQSCIPASLGMYALSGSRLQLACPSSFKCPGASAPIKCPFFFKSEPKSDSCSPSVWLFLFVPSVIISGCIMVILAILFLRGFFSASGKSMLTLKISKSSAESDKLLDKQNVANSLSYQGF